MRGAGRVLAAVAGLSVASAAEAQALTGPLLPGRKPSSVGFAPAKRSGHRAKTVTTKPGAVPASTRIPPIERPAAAPPEPLTAASGDPSGPISLGMKWNGSNDNAAQTRIENLNGQAAGTGAELGMKLHF